MANMMAPRTTPKTSQARLTYIQTVQRQFHLFFFFHCVDVYFFVEIDKIKCGGFTYHDDKIVYNHVAMRLGWIKTIFLPIQAYFLLIALE